MIDLQEPPPFIQYVQEAEALGRASYLSGVCVGLGVLADDQRALADALDEFQRRAVIARTDGPLVDSAFQQGVEREKAAVALMADLGPADGSPRRQRQEAQATEYFVTGCSDLVLDYPSVFRLVPDETETASE
jgi:hypothetical protein